jgi:hypothetical protein
LIWSIRLSAATSVAPHCEMVALYYYCTVCYYCIRNFKSKWTCTGRGSNVKYIEWHQNTNLIIAWDCPFRDRKPPAVQ